MKHKEIKVSIEECTDSVYDKIIKGEKNNLNILYEDDAIIAFFERHPIT